MGWIETYQIDIKITTKSGKVISKSIENTTSSYLLSEDEPTVIAIINPYILCLSETIDELKELIKAGFIYNDDYYNPEKAESYFEKNSAFIKEISKIKSVEDIKSIEISGRSPYDKRCGEIIHRFDVEDMTYHVTDTSDREYLIESRADVIKFNPSYYSDTVCEISFCDSSYNALPCCNSDKKIYNFEQKSIICPVCRQTIDKSNCVISRENKAIYCDSYCVPDSRYSGVRSVFKHQKKATFTVELVHTNKRSDTIELLKPGTKITTKVVKGDVEVFANGESIGMVTLYTPEYSGMYVISKLKKTEKNIITDAWVSTVVPKSQRPKKGMKPIVEVTVEVDILIN